MAPGGCPPGTPTDPYVLALEHTVPQIIHSRQATPRGCRSAIRRRFVDTFPDFDASDVCPSGGRMIRRPASLHAVPRCVSGFPRFRGRLAPPPAVLSGRCDFPPSVSPRLVFLRSAVPSMRSRLFAPAAARTHAGRRAWACCGSASPCRGGRSTETAGSPKFLGNPHCTFAGLFDPGRTMGV